MPTPKTTGLQSQFPSRLFLFFFPQLLIGFTCSLEVVFHFFVVQQQELPEIGDQTPEKEIQYQILYI